MSSVRKLIDARRRSEAEDYDRREEHDSDSHGDGGHDESNWLVSYADMMTLLCGFFIMMFSMAKMDDPVMERVKESVAKQFGGDYKSPTQDLAKFMTQTLEEQGLEQQASIRVDPTGIAIIFKSTVFFDSVSADVTEEGKQILGKLIQSVQERQEAELKKYRVVVEGHTDGRPVIAGVYPSNWELSGARASRVVRLFLEKGFAANRLTAIGYSDTHPELPERSPTGEWIEGNLATNRRVVIRILEPKVEAIPLPTPGH